jgi:hypothetical protein
MKRLTLVLALVSMLAFAAQAAGCYGVPYDPGFGC